MTYEKENYEPLLADSETRSRIMSAKDGMTRPIEFRVYNELDVSENPIVATGTLSENGEWLEAAFTMPDGQQVSRTYRYTDLARKILADFKS
jgi:hypothetical protein